jgi:hypothetical protein
MGFICVYQQRQTGHMVLDSRRHLLLFFDRNWTFLLASTGKIESTWPGITPGAEPVELQLFMSQKIHRHETESHIMNHT